MIDSVEAFKAQFEKVDDGYVIFPLGKSGGKFVTPEEYDQLIAGWQKATSGRRFWGLLVALFAAILAFAFLEQTYQYPEWSRWATTLGVVGLLASHLVWEGLSPQRLVKGRPDYCPPRSKEENQRIARGLIPKHVVGISLILSGMIFGLVFYHGPQSAVDWVWFVGSGLFFVLCLRLVFQSWGDRNS